MRPWHSRLELSSIGHPVRWAIVAILTVTLYRPIAAASYASMPPELVECHPRGLKIGGTTRLTVRGQHLAGGRLLLPLPHSAKLTLIQSTDQELTCDVTLDERVVAGHYPLRVAHADGVSSALTIGLDRLPQIDFTSSSVQLPVALHGSLSGDQRLVTQFSGTENSTLVFDLEGRRLGSSIRPVLRLFGPDDRQLAISRPQIAILGDTRMAVTLPTTGLYRLELHDAVYQGPSPGWFRLKIGPSLIYADRAYPIVGMPGSTQVVEYLGSPLAATRSMQLRWPESGRIQQDLPWPEMADAVFTGPQPVMLAGDPRVAEFTEEMWSVARPQTPRAIGVSGRISKPGEVDHYSIPVNTGERLRIELQAARYGSPLDGVLDLFSGETALPAHAQGNLGHADDQPATADPVLDVQVPADVHVVTVRVSSLLPVGSPEHDYHLTVTPITARPPVLHLDVPRLIIPSGSSIVTALRIEPQEPRGTWRLELADNANSLVSIEAADVDPDETLSLVEWRAAADSRGTIFTRLLVRSTDTALSQSTAARMTPFPGSTGHPDWITHLPVSVVRESPLELHWADGSPPAQWLRGAHQSLDLRWTRPADGHAGPLRLSLVTNQVPPTKSENNATVPDMARTWRMQELSAIRGDQPGAEISVVCPPDLALRNGSLAVKADLLSDDGATVLASVYSPLIRRPVMDALQLQAAIPSKLEATAGDAAGLVVEGTLSRHAEASFPVEVHWEGLPDGIMAPPVRVEADQNHWKLMVTIPAAITAQELKEIRVAARFVDAGEAWSEVIARSEPWTLVIKPPIGQPDPKPTGT